MVRALLGFAVIWLPLFVLFSAHSKWKWSAWKAALGALLWATVAAILTAIIFVVIQVLSK